jgi:hypothetical protein
LGNPTTVFGRELPAQMHNVLPPHFPACNCRENWNAKMAQRVQVTLVCDVHADDTAATETVEFGLDGSAYEVDLCDEHARDLRDRLAGFVGAARRLSGRGTLSPASRGSGRRRRSRGESGEAARIREWARSQGLAVPERGRIPAELAERYAAANSR